MSILKIDGLNFSYNKKRVITDFSLDIKKGQWVTLVGPNGSGKSTLIKIIAGLIKCDSNIKIDDKILNSHSVFEIRKKIGFIFDNPDNMFLGETVFDDIAFGLENLKMKKDEIKRRIEKISSLFGIENILNKSPKDLSGGEKQKVALASVLVLDIKILILDNAFGMIDTSEKESILYILGELNKSGLTIINSTSDLEEAVYSNYIVVMQDGIKVAEGPADAVFDEEQIFRGLGIKLPFMVDLSHKLRDYQLLDRVILNTEEMVNILWP